MIWTRKKEFWLPWRCYFAKRPNVFAQKSYNTSKVIKFRKIVFKTQNVPLNTPANHALQLTACLHFATSLAPALGLICTKLVSGGVFEWSKLFYDFAHLLFSGLPNSNTYGEGCVGVASQLYRVSQSCYNWPWGSKNSNRMCPGLRV